MLIKHASLRLYFEKFSGNLSVIALLALQTLVRSLAVGRRYGQYFAVGKVIHIMRFGFGLLAVVLSFFPSTISAQKTPILPSLDLIQSKPFVLEPGITFAASTSGTSAGNRQLGSAADRERIEQNIREAETIISTRYISPKKSDTSVLTKSAIVSMLHTLDPHSNFFDSAEWRDLLNEQKSGYEGIGMSFSGYSANGIIDTYVISTFDSTPARRAGLRFGDKIVSVNGASTVGKSADAVGDMIRGQGGTSVRLQVERASTGRIETIDLRRGIVPQPSIPDYYIIRDNVGYVDLSEGFNYTTSAELTKALLDLHRSGMRSLIIDLRGNGGGIVDQAIKVAEKFLPSGSLILSERGRTPADSREWRSRNTSPETLPLVILVDENTASASEIVAGALQDSDRALIVGSRTFGKGLVQSVIDLPDRSGMTLTAARYFTPTGRSIQRDYSEIGRYEYFSHRKQDQAIGRPSFESHTITNRTLFGGDGISPDQAVESDVLSASQADLIAPIFFFVREQIRGRTVSKLSSSNEFPETKRIRLLSSDFVVDDLLVKKFEEWIGRQQFPGVNDETVQRELSFIKLQLRYDLTLAERGSVVASQVLKDSDRVIEAGILALPKAESLARLADRIRKERSTGGKTAIFGIQ